MRIYGKECALSIFESEAVIKIAAAQQNVKHTTQNQTRKPGDPSQQRAVTLLLLCLVVTAVLVVLNLPGMDRWNAPIRDTENYLQDYFATHGRFTALSTNLVLIGIDQPSYDGVIFPEDARNDPVLAALCEHFPWSRQVWAALINRLGEAGAKTIVLDLVFAAQADGDDELNQALAKYRDRVVIGSNFSPVDTDRGTMTKLTPPNADLIPDTPEHPAALDPRVGFVNIWPDTDDVLRRAQFRATNHQLGDAINAPAGAVAWSLDALALAKFGAGAAIPAGTQARRFRYAGPPETFPMISLADVLTPKLWAHNYQNGAFFRGKLVLVGPTAMLFQDLHRTPFKLEMPGPEIHLNIINAALHGEFFPEWPPLATAALILLAGLVSALLCQFIRQPVKRLLVVLVLSGAVLAGDWLLFDEANLAPAVVSALIVLNVIGVLSLLYDFIVERLERLKLRHTMGLYFSPRVLDAVLADPGSMQPRRAEVTMLLTDLRNSTPLAEKLGPSGMFALLNQVFEAQTAAIMSEEGNLEHFLGDQFLSYWGAPRPQADAADRAEQAARKLIAAMENLRGTLAPEVQTLFGYGVALHSGRVLVGNKGSALRLDYGLVGDAVNEAARVEALTKYYGVRMLVTRETFAQFGRQGVRRLVDRVIVKGKSAPVELFECANPCTPAAYPEICKRYKAAYDQYFFGQFPEAQILFEAIVLEYDDGPSRALAARCAELLAQPPAAWNGNYKL
jgi:adenylate cyclase